MHQTLLNINDKVRGIEPYLYPDSDQLKKMTEDELSSFAAKRTEAHTILAEAGVKFNQIISQLSVAEILTAYQQSCETLRQMLGGHMYLHFDEKFIDTMVDAIRRNEQESYLFLGRLIEHLDRDRLIPILLDALDHASYDNDTRRLRDTALSFVKQLQIREVVIVDKVQQLTSDHDGIIAKQAGEVLKNLRQE